MIAGVVLTTLTSVTACTQFVHGQCKCLVGLDAQSAKRHSTCYEVLNDALNGLNLVDRRRFSCFLESEEVADEDRTLLFVYYLCPILKLIVVALTGSQLQFCDSLWVPGVLDAVLTPCKLTLVLQQCLLLGSLMQTDSIAGNLLQAHTADGAHLGAEVAMQQVFAQSDALEDLGSTIRADGRDTHLTHNLLQALVHRFDIVLLGSSILLLNLMFLH